MISLVQLCDHLGPELGQAHGERVSHAVLSGVHISELADPTPYLEGGELLLTTGIPLAGDEQSMTAYVQRLVIRGVSALGLGLGAGTDTVPDALRSACAIAGLELLVVPAGIPFLHVSRAYWDLVGRADQADLAAGLRKQTSLARAATRPEAVAGVIRMLAETTQGWAAYLPTDGRAATVWPNDQRAVLPLLRSETARLNLAGTYSSATFPLGDTDVIVYSIVVDRTTVGFLAVGASRALRRADRQLMLTGCMLLAVTAQQERQLSKANARRNGAVASLVVNGYPDAARLAVHELGLPTLPKRVSLLAISGDDLDALGGAGLADLVAELDAAHEHPDLRQRIRHATLRCEVNGLTVVLLEAENSPANSTASAEVGSDSPSTDHPSTDHPSADPRDTGNPGVARNSASSTSSGVFAVLSHDVHLEQVAETWSEVMGRCRRAHPGQLVPLRDESSSYAHDWVAALREYPRADLVETVRSYLRHRGQWEVTARALGVHRNSLRHRIAVASGLIQADLDDPDVAANLWLALRSHS